MTRIPVVAAAILLFIALRVTPVAAAWSVDVESGVAYNGYNDVRIPGDTGTRFSLTDELSSGGTGFVRVRLTTDLGSRHRLSVLAAPLRIEATGRTARDVDYNGVRFTAGDHLDARYRFDSYRLTYRYALVASERLRFDLGFTGKIRDAAIRVASADTSAEKTNTGFVPLINFEIDWSLTRSAGIILSGDALAAPQGRAEDVLLALRVDAARQLRFRLGYRLLEGGADNDKVYNFALVHYLAAGVTWTL